MAAPIVKNCDGDYSYEKFKNSMFWRISTIDKSNATGTFEFTVSGSANDFFPVNVQFTSETSYCDIKVNNQEFFLVFISRCLNPLFFY